SKSMPSRRASLMTSAMWSIAASTRRRMVSAARDHGEADGRAMTVSGVGGSRVGGGLGRFRLRGRLGRRGDLAIAHVVQHVDHVLPKEVGQVVPALVRTHGVDEGEQLVGGRLRQGVL